MLAGKRRSQISMGILTICTLAYFQSDAQAQSTPPDPIRLINDIVIGEIRDRIETDVTYLALAQRNALTEGLSADEVDALDQQWRQEHEQAEQPLISGIFAAPLSGYLLRVQAGSLGLYPEIFVFDLAGLNVGMSSVTGDFWQGDEAKYQNTVPVGADAVFIDEAEFHEDSGTWRAQLNFTIADGRGQPLGGVTVEYNLTELARREAAGL